MAGSRCFLPLCFLAAFSALVSSSILDAGVPLFLSVDRFLEASSSGISNLDGAIKPLFLLEAESASDPSQKILLSGEGGLAFFDTGPDGPFPNAEFRVDEAKLFVDASPGDDVYFFSEFNFASREADTEFELGELYAEFENISRFWNHQNLLSVRAGRMDIPFGEEYLTRDAIDNPLISHSLSDLWGVDEGVEIYGKIKRAQYVLAIQNGSLPKFRDFNSDKSVCGRFSLDLPLQIHLSVSAMRTGDLDVQNDFLSAIWFGSGFFRSLGSQDTTTAFHANLVQADGEVNTARASFNASGGMASYGDDDTSADNSRNVSYFHIEGVYNLIQEAPKLHAAVRVSRMSSSEGFPLVGDGDFGEYFFDSLTESIWRLSLGAGLHVNRNTLIKVEYTFEGGKLLSGSERNEENFFGVEAAMRF